LIAIMVLVTLNLHCIVLYSKSRTVIIAMLTESEVDDPIDDRSIVITVLSGADTQIQRRVSWGGTMVSVLWWLLHNGADDDGTDDENTNSVNHNRHVKIDD
jgi:hypothetical protein